MKSILLLLSLTSNLYGQVTLSEVLSNEPDGRVRLEWVELYNRADDEIDLGGYVLIAGDDTTRFLPGTFIDGRSFAVIARQPLPDNGSDSFEGYWGDSSGIWGDSEFENYPVIPGNIHLNNNSGSITIIDSTGAHLDQFNWDISSDDARSMEKDDLFFDFTTWHESFDPSGSTPGRANSEIPLEGTESLTMNIYPPMISSGAGEIFYISAIIPPGSKLSVDIYDDTGLRRRSLLENIESIIVNTDWNGRDDSDKMLSPGLYIMVASLSGGSSGGKQIPVVIAP